MPQMDSMEWILDTLLVVLLTATLFHAVRLERALGVLKRDRAELEALVASFNASTRAAEAGVEHLRAATDGSGRQIQRQIDAASVLKDDLTFLVQRGEGLADRLDDGVRAARPAVPALASHEHSAARTAYASRMGTAPPESAGNDRGGSEAGSHLARVSPRDVSPGDGSREISRGDGSRPGSLQDGLSQAGAPRMGAPQFGRGNREEPKVRSQAERDLLKALRMAR